MTSNGYEGTVPPKFKKATKTSTAQGKSLKRKVIKIISKMNAILVASVADPHFSHTNSDPAF
jgi:hypothetical protein